MDMKPYDYSHLAEHSGLLALYLGWVGQKICALIRAISSRWALRAS